jgi:hypothetical protein
VEAPDFSPAEVYVESGLEEPVPLLLVCVLCENSTYELSPEGTAESSPGRQSWVGMTTRNSPEGTAENVPGRQSWDLLRS